MRQPPPKRSAYDQRRRQSHRSNPPHGYDVQIDGIVLIALGLLFVGLFGAMLYAAPVIVLVIGVIAGLAAASVVVPYLVIWIVTGILERMDIAQGSVDATTEPDLHSEVSQEDS